MASCKACAGIFWWHVCTFHLTVWRTPFAQWNRFHSVLQMTSYFESLKNSLLETRFFCCGWLDWRITHASLPALHLLPKWSKFSLERLEKKKGIWNDSPLINPREILANLSFLSECCMAFNSISLWSHRRKSALCFFFSTMILWFVNSQVLVFYLILAHAA